LVVLCGGPFVLQVTTKNPKNDALDLTLRSGRGGVDAVQIYLSELPRRLTSDIF
jgi:hypothetical protein